MSAVPLDWPSSFQYLDRAVAAADDDRRHDGDVPGRLGAGNAPHADDALRNDDELNVPVVGDAAYCR
jgi:hypothetical protein